MIGSSVRTRSHLLIFAALLSPIFSATASVSAGDTAAVANEQVPKAGVDAKPEVAATEQVAVLAAVGEDITRK